MNDDKVRKFVEEFWGSGDLLSGEIGIKAEGIRHEITVKGNKILVLTLLDELAVNIIKAASKGNVEMALDYVKAA